MKSIFIILTICLSVIVSAFYFNNKIEKQTDEIDIIENGFSSATKIIKPNSTLLFVGQTDLVQLFSISRFVLAPALLQPYTTDNNDTLIAIQKNTNNDSSINSIMQNRETIWSVTDSVYTYSISIPR